MSKQSEHTKFQERTADEYRQVADAHAQELKGFWKRFAVSGLFVIAVVVIIFASLAWFASNRAVDASTSAISAKAGRFSIEGVADGENAQVGYYERSDTDSSAKPTDLQTNDSMKVSTIFNLNNYTGGSLRPGSSGELQITVTPVAKDVGDVTITLERIVEMRTDYKDKSGSDVDGKTIPSQADLEDLFRGHVVFFKAKSNGYYSDPILDDVLTVTADQFCEDESSETTKPVTITLYWVWPSQFSSFVLTGQINYNPNLFETADAVGYSDLLSSINNSRTGTSSSATSSSSETGADDSASSSSGRKALYYRADSWGVPSADAVPEVSNGMSAADLQACAAYYNYADEALGTCAAFLQVRFTAVEAVS